MRTLQLYVTRELLKTLALTVVGLTLVLSLCGAMSTLLRIDVPTAGTVLHILWLIQPMVLAITLPVSALFACAIVYGRMAADNEFDACRASGVNIHRLLAPAFALGLLTAAFAFVFSNYVIPKAAKGIVNRIQVNISKIAYQAIKNKGHFKLEDKKKNEVRVLYAGNADLVNEPDRDVLLIGDAAFLEFKKDELLRCGTVGQAQAEFKAADESHEPLVEVSLEDVRAVDIAPEGGRLIQNRRQSFGSRELPNFFYYDPKWLALGDLLEYERNPTRLPPIRLRLTALRQSVRENAFYRRICDRFNSPGKSLVMDDGQHRYEIKAESAKLLEEDFSPELEKVKVTYTWVENNGREKKRYHRYYEAGSAALKIDRNYSNTRDVLQMTLQGGVRFKDSINPNKWVAHSSIDLEPVAAPAEFLTEDKAYTDEQLLVLDAIASGQVRNREDLEKALQAQPLGLGPQIEKLRLKTVADMIREQHEIVGTLHSRLSLCASALVTILLAAALGIIFRNGQFLTAFSISFLPGLVIVALNMLGRRQSESPDPYLHVIGVSIIWAGIVLLALVDVVVLKRYLRR